LTPKKLVDCNKIDFDFIAYYTCVFILYYNINQALQLQSVFCVLVCIYACVALLHHFCNQKMINEIPYKPIGVIILCYASD